MAVTVKTVPPTVFVMSSHEDVTIPEIPAVSRGVVDDMISDLQLHGVMPLAPVHFIYHGADGTLTKKFRLTIAFPIAKAPAQPIEDYEVAELPAFKCMASEYIGPMPDIQIAYDEILHAIDASGRKRTPESREIYKKWIGFESPDNVTELQVGVA
jgi:effector-binding domain-containing protein